MNELLCTVKKLKRPRQGCRLQVQVLIAFYAWLTGHQERLVHEVDLPVLYRQRYHSTTNCLPVSSWLQWRHHHFLRLHFLQTAWPILQLRLHHPAIPTLACFLDRSAPRPSTVTPASALPVPVPVLSLNLSRSKSAPELSGTVPLFFIRT